MRAFYESKLLVSTLDEFVRVIKVVHVSKEDYADDKPGVALQNFLCDQRSVQRVKFVKVLGAILNRHAVACMNNSAQKLLLMFKTEF
jgi:hypothetical protein